MPREGRSRPEPELRRRWAARAEPFGFDIADLPLLRRTPIVDRDDGVTAAHLTEQHATYERRDVVRIVAQAATQGATLADIEANTNEFLTSAQAVAVRDGRWTTPEMLAMERRTVDTALAAKDAGRGLAPRDVVSSSIAERPSLGADQARAVRAITTSGDGVDIVIGPAGTGKTFCLDAAREAWQRSGHRVLGVALSARAAAELQHGAGIRSQTADRLLTRASPAAVSSSTNARLSSSTRRACSARVGSPRSSRRRTRPPRKSCSSATRSSCPRSTPGDCSRASPRGSGTRHSSPIDASAIAKSGLPRDELRSGQVERAIARLQRHGRVTTADNADLLRDGLVGDWHAARDAGEHVLMVAAHRSAVADLNERARQVCKEAGELGQVVLTVDDLEFATGDEVLAQYNDYSLGVLNGNRGVVQSARDSTLLIELEGGRMVEIPLTYVEAGHLTHGYATTAHKSQATTCDRVLVLGDDTFNRELGYTSLTRGRDRNQVYLVAPHA